MRKRSPYAVTKVISFCYGHRLLNYKGPCRHLHGHNAKVEIELVAKQLDRRGMVCDFSKVKKEIKRWIDQNLDHRMILNSRDPLLPLLQKAKQPCFALDENPTAENLAKRIFQHASKCGLAVQSVKFWETPQSCAVYKR